MEIRSTRHMIIGLVRFTLWTLVLMVMGILQSNAQETVKYYGIRNGKMHIELSKRIGQPSLDSFILQYNLGDIGLHQLIKTGSGDSLKKQGWKVDANGKQVVILEKSLESIGEIASPEGKIIFTEKHPTLSELFPAVNNGIQYGYNKFRNKYPFLQTNNSVIFFLRNNLRAGRVMLAGSFNSWKPDVLAMTKTDSGWIAHVPLGPGKYWYKFVVDGGWTTDDDNQLRENDGRGNINSVFYVTNFIFNLYGFNNARRVYVSGSFNNWRSSELQMVKTDWGWQLPIFLAEGTHTYRFVVDGKWMEDPSNKEKYPNEYHEYNSVIRFGKMHQFKLNGYGDAKQVILTGSFNAWRRDELFMTKTPGGWQLPYTLGPGNYEYAFIVDGKHISDPDNPLATNADNSKANSYLIIEPNYVFRLKGFRDAKKVYLTGDFNNWNPTMLQMMKDDGGGWIFGVHLSSGKHLYKFIVDGKWIIDPDNPLWEQNEYKTGNSVIWFDK